MASTVADVATRARDVINDPGKVRWTDAELMRWVGDALDLILKANKMLFVKRANFSTVVGAIQTIGFARASEFVEVIGVPLCDRAALDAYSPGWQNGASGAIQHWLPSIETRLGFLVYPPSPGGVTLKVVYVEAPAEFTALTDALPVADEYVGLLADFVIGMSEAKDAAHVNSGRAQTFMSAFAQKLAVDKPQA